MITTPGRTFVTLSLVLAIFRSFSMVALAAPQTTASISVIGEVMVNDTRTTSVPPSFRQPSDGEEFQRRGQSRQTRPR